MSERINDKGTKREARIFDLRSKKQITPEAIAALKPQYKLSGGALEYRQKQEQEENRQAILLEQKAQEEKRRQELRERELGTVDKIAYKIIERLGSVTEVVAKMNDRLEFIQKRSTPDLVEANLLRAIQFGRTPEIYLGYALWWVKYRAGEGSGPKKK